MGNKKVNVVTIRLSDDEIKPFFEAMESLGIKNKSEFYRAVLLNNFDPNKHDKSNQEKLNKILFYYNKSSNNLNQIAKAVNTFVMKGGVTEQEKINILNRLNLIVDLLKENLDEKK